MTFHVSQRCGSVFCSNPRSPPMLGKYRVEAPSIKGFEVSQISYLKPACYISRENNFSFLFGLVVLEFV